MMLTCREQEVEAEAAWGKGLQGAEMRGRAHFRATVFQGLPWVGRLFWWQDLLGRRGCGECRDAGTEVSVRMGISKRAGPDPAQHRGLTRHLFMIWGLPVCLGIGAK